MSFKCVDCFHPLTGYNTKGAWRNKSPKTRRCGVCYLKWKKEKRSRENAP